MKQNKALVIGVTGGVGAGKSTVLSILEDNYNALIVKADEIGNEVKLKGNVCYDELIELLGKEVLSNNGEIDKKIMASMIFSDENLLNKVNSIIHPAVRRIIETVIEENCNNYEYIIVEAALLCEANYFPILNALFEVRTSQDVRIQRLVESRGYSVEKCRDIIGNQSDVSFYKASSDNYELNSERNDYFGYYLIENNGNETDLNKMTDKAMEELHERIR